MANSSITNTNLSNFIADSVAIVNARLDDLVPDTGVEPAKLHEAIRHSLFAVGKRFRPVYVFAIGETFGVDAVRLTTVAAAIEMIHTYSLIHDDLPSMDDDDLRRGRETCHIKFGEATAILAGDALETLAFQAIAEDAELTHELRTKIISEIARGAGTPNGMVSGQHIDLESEGKKISVAELDKIHHQKTGRMIVVSGRVAAIIAGASDQELEAVSRFSKKLGLLFQITDDLLDITESTAVLGKTAGSDVANDKVTYPSYFGVEDTRKLADEVHYAAIGELAAIEKPTELLVRIADFVLNRRA